MASCEKSDSPEEQSLSKLTGAAQKDFETQQAFWDRSAAKREVLDLLQLKLVADDDRITTLLKEAHQASAENTKLLLRPPPGQPGDDPFPDPDPDPSTPLPVITTQIRSPFELRWTWNSAVSDPPLAEINENSSGLAGIFIIVRTDHGRPNESARGAFGGWYTPPRSGTMTVTASPSISYEYGNHGILRSTHTHGWVGIVVQQFKDGIFQRDVIVQQNNLWDLTTDHDFRGEVTPTQFTSFVAIQGYTYAVWLWAGGNVESNALSYAHLTLFFSNITVRLS